VARSKIIVGLTVGDFVVFVLTDGAAVVGLALGDAVGDCVIVTATYKLLLAIASVYNCLLATCNAISCDVEKFGTG